MQHPEETSSEEKLDGENENNPKLQRNIGLVDGVSVIVGIIIGTGIFASPGVIVSHVNQLGVSLLVWIGGGILSMLGGLCFAELGASLPATGGGFWRIFFIIRNITFNIHLFGKFNQNRLCILERNTSSICLFVFMGSIILR